VFNATMYEIALRTRDLTEAEVTRLDDGKVVVTATKPGAVVQHLGRNEDDARERLARLVTRR
jgi:hypothetical protein